MYFIKEDSYVPCKAMALSTKYNCRHTKPAYFKNFDEPILAPAKMTWQV
jgi:hypothetical protein